MMILEKINTTILLITIALVFPVLESCAQTDDLSKGEYRKTHLTKAWQKLDTNNDGQFTESENERSWKRLKKLDKNKDLLKELQRKSMNFGTKKWGINMTTHIQVVKKK